MSSERAEEIIKEVWESSNGTDADIKKRLAVKFKELILVIERARELKVASDIAPDHPLIPDFAIDAAKSGWMEWCNRAKKIVTSQKHSENEPDVKSLILDVANLQERMETLERKHNTMRTSEVLPLLRRVFSR